MANCATATGRVTQQTVSELSQPAICAVEVVWGGGEDKEAGGGRGAYFGSLRVSEHGNYLCYLVWIRSGP